MGEKKPRVSYKTLHTESNELVNQLKGEVNQLKGEVGELRHDVSYWRDAYEKAYAERGVWAKVKEFFLL